MQRPIVQICLGALLFVLLDAVPYEEKGEFKIFECPARYDVQRLGSDGEILPRVR